MYTKIFKVWCNILNNKQMKKCRAEQPKKVGIHAVGGSGPQIQNLYLLTISDLWSI